ncbi:MULTISPECIES: NAD(P)-dependent oxidoreductase [unclassified Mycolicibacterium]|uniref:NAD(P)-dependent oxidoreductase n=1 Tax=unclassified Mycolicibacterium TaxID=2636767 RepID=UPI0012DEC5DF|nr:MULTISPECIES: NAD(P)H-binding protein [unclassified Mycolicibacterium]MUL80611.1 NAD(P)H-binding protein [Mycolicibacterium sp. CBMA 329]MUL86378.1 NAD(P)H-binding protein [Mycolicibacterium sp. CBMA 331]MUM01240.1 NAD(P)H-binding protein [Mycolicibacterium sp. CBMA 334]MUM29001.1 NAD(P)H-binding protein [Mycolicibacterium sp. CBMA 295]MUM36674.1 NAD(P)H-binding protein [Mycolicibacterium sp. CBMA 247]
MRIVIFGANGATGRLLTRRALDAGHTVVAVTRHPEQFPITGAALTVAGVDVHDGAAVTAAVDGADAVLSTLGVTFTMEPVDTYSAGVGNIVKAMRTTGVERLAVVSSTAVADYPGRTDTPFALRLVQPVISRLFGKTLYADMRRMEDIVADSGLDWTIVRPSGLFDLPNVTEYLAGQRDPAGAFTSRTDLADYLLKLAESPETGATVTISTTVDTPSMWQLLRREALKSA